MSTEQGRALFRDLVPRWLCVTVLLPTCAVLAWKYFDLRGDFAEQRRDLSLERDAVNRLSSELKTERDRAAALEAKERILKLLGPRFWGYRSFDLRNEPGARMLIGQCGRQPCFVIELNDVDLRKNPPTASLRIDGIGFGLPGGINFVNNINLVPGYRRFIAGNGLDFLVAVEDTSVNNLRLGVAVRDSDHIGLEVRDATDADMR